MRRTSEAPEASRTSRSTSFGTEAKNFAPKRPSNSDTKSPASSSLRDGKVRVRSLRRPSNLRVRPRGSEEEADEVEIDDDEEERSRTLLIRVRFGAGLIPAPPLEFESVSSFLECLARVVVVGKFLRFFVWSSFSALAKAACTKASSPASSTFSTARSALVLLGVGCFGVAGLGAGFETDFFAAFLLGFDMVIFD